MALKDSVQNGSFEPFLFSSGFWHLQRHVAKISNMLSHHIKENVFVSPKFLLSGPGAANRDVNLSALRSGFGTRP